jgi:hypothetical protein
MTVHAGLLRPAVMPFVEALTKYGRKHYYYNSTVEIHSNPFLLIHNGEAATTLPSFSNLDFDLAMSHVNESVVGQ